ncbi:hypothetical protein SAMN04488583_6106 [Mycobacterium sp. 88mf]|nr:hypothetical protein SAMN04488583_6106 [Mycobacterium sp. 88mf]SFG51723.1 hypothetical protein SAMN04488582_108183 [Mycobacterium sp. 455mf]
MTLAPDVRESRDARMARRDEVQPVQSSPRRPPSQRTQAPQAQRTSAQRTTTAQRTAATPRAATPRTATPPSSAQRSSAQRPQNAPAQVQRTQEQRAPVQDTKAQRTQGQGTQTPRTPVQRSQQPAQPRQSRPAKAAPPQRQPAFDDRPVEYWPTAAIRAALETDDMAVWQRIVAAIKRDPYGRTARQVEEVLQTARPYGVSKALSEVLVRTREHLEATERAEVARQIQAMLRRSELQAPEFASRVGVSNESFADYLEGTTSPPASLLLRMQRLSDRFAKLSAQRSAK